MWRKGTKVLHGIGGLCQLASGCLALIHFFVNGMQRNIGSMYFERTFLISSLLLSLGFFTPYFQRTKLNKLGKYQIVFHSNMLIVLSMSFAINSKYAQQQQQQDPYYDTTTSSFTSVCTTLSLTLPLMALGITFLELYKQASFNSKSVFISYSTSYPLLYGPYLYEKLYGRDALQQLYTVERPYFSDAVYILNLAGAICCSIAMVALTMVMKKVITTEQRQRFNGYMWILYGTFVITIITFYCGIQFSILYLVCCTIEIPMTKYLIPTWCFEQYNYNRQ